MKLLWTLGFVSALRVPVGDFLLEKQKILDKFRFPRNAQNQGIRPEMPRQLGKLRSVKSPGEKFVFELGSYEIPSLVHELETSLQIAGGFIENALVFNTPIKVQVNQGNYCEQGGVCGQDQGPSVAGACWPKIEKTGNGVYIDYPRALAIQKGASEPRGFDMEMYVQSCDNCVYPGSYGEDDKSIDMLEIIIHEMSHGLGFTSSLASNRMCGPGGPSIWQGRQENYSFAFVKESFFDVHLYTDNVSLHEKLKELNSTRSLGDRVDMENICNHKVIRELKGFLATPNSIYFKTTKGSRVYVEINPNPVVSRVSHINWEKYHMTQDFLMVPSAYLHGHMLKNLSKAQDWSTAPLGKYTLEIFETLGYKVNVYPDFDRSQLALYLQMKQHKNQ